MKISILFHVRTPEFALQLRIWHLWQIFYPFSYHRGKKPKCLILHSFRSTTLHQFINKFKRLGEKRRNHKILLHYTTKKHFLGFQAAIKAELGSCAWATNLQFKSFYTNIRWKVALYQSPESMLRRKCSVKYLLH